MKNEKNYMGFLIHKIQQIFEAFHWNIFFSANLLFMKSVSNHSTHQQTSDYIKKLVLAWAHSEKSSDQLE